MACTLLRYPQEIFSNIIGHFTDDDTYVNRRSLGNLRLAGSHELAERVAPLLLHSLGLWVSQ